MIHERHMKAAEEILWTRKIQKELAQLTNVSLEDKFECSRYHMYRITCGLESTLPADDVSLINACLAERDRLKALLIGHSQKEIFRRHGASYETVIRYVEDFAECGARV